MTSKSEFEPTSNKTDPLCIIPLTRASYALFDARGQIVGELKRFWCPACGESGSYQSQCCVLKINLMVN